MYLGGPSPEPPPATRFTMAYFVSVEPETTLPTPTLTQSSITVLPSAEGLSLNYDVLGIIIGSLLGGIILCAAISYWCVYERRRLEAGQR